MKTIIFGTIALVGVGVAPALAADLPAAAPVYSKAPPPIVAPVYNWTGFYVGGNVGWGNSTGGNGESCLNSAGTPAGCQVLLDSGLHGSGALGGGQIGYNWQNGIWVFGLEADIQGANIKGSASLVPLSNFGTFTASQSIDWFGTARGRIGVASNRVLFYATGGLIYGDVKTSQNFVFPTQSFPATSDSTKVGWTLGGGIEWAFAPSWSVKFEGLYYDLGSVTTAATQVPPPSGFTDLKTFGFHGAIARAGVNYKFGGPVVARY